MCQILDRRSHLISAAARTDAAVHLFRINGLLNSRVKSVCKTDGTWIVAGVVRLGRCFTA